MHVSNRLIVTLVCMRTIDVQRTKDAGMMDAFAEWEREEAQRQLMLIATGQMDPVEMMKFSGQGQEEKPLYTFLLGVFDERVQVGCLRGLNSLFRCPCDA